MGRADAETREDRRCPLGLGQGITRNVAALALVSLLTDVSSEMLVYVVPLFLVNVLAASPAIVGLIEGIAESTAGLLKLVSGSISDRIGRRKLLVGHRLQRFGRRQGALPVRHVVAHRAAGATGRPLRQGRSHVPTRRADRRLDR